ncbi:MAG: radical SAM protein [Kiritimatiellae bacterium]|nr:radical SAM protein [Kiritimatiellia bacterium]
MMSPGEQLEKWADNQPDGPYWSCSYIESGLAFNVGSITACCVTQYKLRWPFLAQFRGGELPLDRIMQRKEQMVRLNQQKQYPQCANCSRLKYQTWTPRAYLFDTLLIANFRYCNIACKYCAIAKRRANRKKAYDLYPVVKNMLEGSILAPGGTIHWGGGEPTIFKDFEPVLELLRPCHYHHIIYTNGVVYSRQIEELLRERHATVTCSVDSGTRETYRILKKKDYHEVVWENIAQYAATGAKVTAKFLIMPENVHDVIPFMEKVMVAGITSVACDLDCTLSMVPSPIIDAVKSFIQNGRTHGLHVSLGTFLNQILREPRGSALKEALIVDNLLPGT